MKMHKEACVLQNSASSMLSQSLKILEQFLERCRASATPQSFDHETLEAAQQLARQAEASQTPALAILTRALVQALEDMWSRDILVDAQRYDVLVSALDHIIQLLQTNPEGYRATLVTGELLYRIRALSEPLYQEFFSETHPPGTRRQTPLGLFGWGDAAGWESFLEEAGVLVEESGVALKRWTRDPSSEAAGERLQWALQGLTEAAKQIGYESIEDLAHALLTVAVAMRHGSLSCSSQTFSALRRALEYLIVALERLEQGHLPGDTEAAIHALDALFQNPTAGKHASLGVPLVDKEVPRAVRPKFFNDETRLLLQAVEGDLQDWHVEPTDHDVMQRLRRHVRGLKRAARLLDLPPIAMFLEMLEALITGFLSGLVPVNERTMTATDAAIDQLTTVTHAALMGETTDSVETVQTEIAVLLSQPSNDSLVLTSTQDLFNHAPFDPGAAIVELIPVLQGRLQLLHDWLVRRRSVEGTPPNAEAPNREAGFDAGALTEARLHALLADLQEALAGLDELPGP